MTEPCPRCETYRRLVESDHRVMAAQVDLLRALLMGVETEARSIAFMKQSIEQAIALSTLNRPEPPAPPLPLGSDRVQ